MARGVKKLRKIQLGKEVTPGTAVAATTIWRGTGVLDDQREVVEVEEDVGLLGGTDRTHIPFYLGGLELEETPATFEQIQYLLAMGFGGPTTGVADGVGDGYVYTTNIPESSLPTAAPYTIQGGDNFEVERGEYALCTKISLSGRSKEALKMSATLMLKQVARLAAFTGALTIPPVEDILVQRGKVYLDAVGDDYGDTQVSGMVLGVALELQPLWEPKYFVEDSLGYAAAQFVGYAITGSITFEHDTNAGGDTGQEKANWRNQVTRLLRLQFEGATFDTGGTYTKKTLQINLPIKWKKFNPISDQNGNDIVVADFFSKYNVSKADGGSFVVVNELSALP